jgi:RsiW-degrading membrane proteinase PrsW (M82 family)
MDIYVSKDGVQAGPFAIEQVKQMVDAGQYSLDDYGWHSGLSDWVLLSSLLPDQGSGTPPPLPQSFEQTTADYIKKGTAAFDTFVDKVTDAAGVDRVEGLSGKDMFSGVFHKKTEDDIEDFFILGTRHTTPELKDIKTEWPKPWAFFKAFTFSAIICALFIWGYVNHHNINLVPGLIFSGAFAVPFSTLIFFIEMNAPRNVSMYQVFRLIILGGVSSMLLTLTLHSFLPDIPIFSAVFTGIVEETAKVITVIRLMRNSRYTWTLNGLLIGAAVGTGFAAFETAGYILRAGLHSDSDMLETMVQRGLLAPFGHIVWTGLAGAAFWKVKGTKKFQWGMLTDFRFLRVLGLVMAFHAIWDMDLTLPFLQTEQWFLKCIILGVVAWIIVLSYIQDGLKQIREAQKAESNPATSVPTEGLIVVAE